MADIVYVYVFDTYSDWEIAYVTAELNEGNLFREGVKPFHIVTIGNSTDPVRSIGGLNVLPDAPLDSFDLSKAAALILPGGKTWQSSEHEPILKLARRCLEKNILVAAICGATVALAESGLLNDRKHTSNDLDYLKQTCPHYNGEENYLDQPSVLDNHLVTAGGIAPVDFSQDIFTALDVIEPDIVDAWGQLYLTRDPKFYLEIMEALQ